MLKRRYILLILIVFFAVYSLYAHNPFTTLDHTPFSKFLEGTSAAITCNFEGRTFTRTRYYYSDGYLHSTAWYPSITTPSMKIESKGHGLGFAQVKLYGNIDGKSVGNANDWGPAIEIGLYTPGIPAALYAHDVDVNASHSGTSTTNDGTHHWDGSGTIQYTPYYYKVRASLPKGVSGTWENGATWSTSDSKPDGSWEITYNTETLSYPKYPGSQPPNGDSPSDDDDSPSWGCAQSPNGNWCDDDGTCTSSSGAGVPGPDCGQNWCCCRSYNNGGSGGSTPPTDSGSGDSTPPTDSGSGDSNSGCAQNPNADYCDDQGSCTVGSPSGVPGPECGENNCCCPMR